MTTTKRWAAAAALAIFAAAGAVAQEIKISHQFKANADARDMATREFVKEVNKRDPNLKFRIYPAQSLGIKPIAQLDALQNGTLEMAVFPMSYAVGKAQEFSIVIMPGTVPTLEHAMKLRGTPFQKKLQDLAHAHGIHIVTWWWTPGKYSLWMLMQPLVMSKQHWDKLTPAQQKIFEEAAARSDEYFVGTQREAVADMEKAYRNAGGKVREMTQAEYDQWLALAKDTAWKEFAARSPAARDLLDALLAVK